DVGGGTLPAFDPLVFGCRYMQQVVGMKVSIRGMLKDRDSHVKMSMPLQGLADVGYSPSTKPLTLDRISSPRHNRDDIGRGVTVFFQAVDGIADISNVGPS